MKQNLDEYKNDILWKEDPNTIHIRSDLLVSERVVDMLGDVSNKRIIDLGCGNGKVSRWLNKKGAKVTGVDALDDQIDIARQVSSQEDDNINYLIADISDDDFKSPEEMKTGKNLIIFPVSFRAR